MRKCRLLTRHDLDEIEKFSTFLERWNKDRVETLSDPEIQKYLNITPDQAKIMIQKIEACPTKK